MDQRGDVSGQVGGVRGWLEPGCAVAQGVQPRLVSIDAAIDELTQVLHEAEHRRVARARGCEVGGDDPEVVVEALAGAPMERDVRDARLDGVGV